MMRKIYNKIIQIAGNVIVVAASGVRYGELALVSSDGSESLAEVIRIDGEKVYLQVLAGSSGISTNDEVCFLGRHMKVPFTSDLLGRVFDGTGKPRDNGPSITENLVDVGGPTVNPTQRVIASTMIHTGIPMIDMFNSLVESQKISIFTTSGEPYNELLARIALQAQVDIIVLGGMGLRYDDYLF